MLRALLLLLVASAGCDGPPPAPPPRAPAARPEVPPAPLPRATPPSDPVLPDDLDEPVEGLPDGVTPPAALIDAHPEQAGACVLASERRRVLEGAGPTAIAAAPDGQLVVAAYVGTDAGEALALARVRPEGLPSLLTRIPLEGRVPSRSAPPALSSSEAGLLVAATDAAGRVLVADIDLSLGATAGHFFADLAAAHADVRFAPVVHRAADGTRLVAWTDGSQTPMRVHLTRFAPSGEALRTETISPDGGGAAPVLALGASTPSIYLVEARVAMSVVHRVGLGPDGRPMASEVARPIFRGAEPPAIAVARAASGTRVHLAYAAVGNLATRAIGLVQASGTDSPVALVPGLGYGAPISVRSAPLSRSVAFAMEAPSASDPSAPHEVRVRLAADDGTLGPPLVLSDRRAPDVVLLGELLAVGTEGAEVTFLRCRE